MNNSYQNCHIYLLHGVGGHEIILYPLMYYLMYYGYGRIDTISYDVDKQTFEESLNEVSDKIEYDKNGTYPRLIFIGQSMGGVIANNLHKLGWNIFYIITIGSPLHGARLLNQLDSILPDFIRDLFYKKPYEYLMTKGKDEIPPHDYHTISMSWIGTENFDGYVYKDEAMLDSEKHTHLNYADHRTIFMNPRLFFTIHNILDRKCNETNL